MSMRGQAMQPRIAELLKFMEKSVDHYFVATYDPADLEYMEVRKPPFFTPSPCAPLRLDPQCQIGSARAQTSLHLPGRWSRKRAASEGGVSQRDPMSSRFDKIRDGDVGGMEWRSGIGPREEKW